MTVSNHLAGGRATGRKAQVEDHVVQTGFQNLKHGLASHTTAFQGALIDPAKLLFHQPVVIAKLLLLDQSKSVVSVLAARLRAMNAWTVITALEVFRGTKNRDAE